MHLIGTTRSRCLDSDLIGGILGAKPSLREEQNNLACKNEIASLDNARNDNSFSIKLE
jgi:hypothetical protein